VARLGRGQPNRPIILRARAAPAAVQATIGVEFGLSAVVAKHVEVDVTIAVEFDLTATATKQTGLDLPRRRRPWQLVAGPATGGHEISLTAAKGRRYTAKLTEPSELGFGINARHSQATAIDELASDVHMLWTSPAGSTLELDRLRVGSTGDTGTDKEHTMTAACLDYREVVKRRILYPGATLTHTAVDQGEIAWSLIDYTQNLDGGDLGISKGWSGTAPTGVTRDRTYEVGNSIGERIQELSELLDGFDWDISPDGASALTLDVWSPQRGSDRGVVLEFGGLVASFRREVNPSDYANAIRMSGEEALTAAERTASDIASRAEGRWDAQLGDTGLTTQAALDERADWQLEQSQVITPVWTVTLRRGSWDGPDHIWLGDPVRLVVKSGRLDVDTTLRVYEVGVSIGDNGDEQIDLSLGGPRPDYRRRPRRTERRLNTLERR
jgi:peptidoglycan/xylan/chitin deacetylase (PgdA/CDA1 family)